MVSTDASSSWMAECAETTDCLDLVRFKGCGDDFSDGGADMGGGGGGMLTGGGGGGGGTDVTATGCSRENHINFK